MRSFVALFVWEFKLIFPPREKVLWSQLTGVCIQVCLRPSQFHSQHDLRALPELVVFSAQYAARRHGIVLEEAIRLDRVVRLFGAAPEIL